LSRSGLDVELAAIGHGVASIHGEVHNHLLETAGIGHHDVGIRRRNRDHVDVFANQPAEQLFDLDHQFVYPDHTRLHGLAAAECQQLVGQRTATFG
jgi:hypothetical protein